MCCIYYEIPFIYALSKKRTMEERWSCSTICVVAKLRQEHGNDFHIDCILSEQALYFKLHIWALTFNQNIFSSSSSSSCHTISTDVTPTYGSSLLVASLDYTPYPHWGAACMFELVALQPCERVHRSTSLMSSTLLLQQRPVCLVRLTWIVFEMGGRWP